MTRLRGRRKLGVVPVAILTIALFLGGMQLGTAGVAQAQPPYPGLCDVNVDGSETIQDALLVAQHVVGLTSLSQTIVDGPADCNGSENVSISDALLIAQKVVGLA